MRRFSFLASAVLFLALPSIAQTSQHTAPAASKMTSSPQVVWAGIPLAFESNQGQAPTRVQWQTRAASMQIGFEAAALEMVPETHGAHPFRLSLIHGDASAAIVPAEKTGGESNYMVGQDTSKWHTHIAQYGRITYQQIYPGVDLTFYGNNSRLEHDFIVQPGADYRQIRMRYDAAKKLTLSTDGDLRVRTEDGELVVHAPVVYQQKDGQRQKREGRFVLLSSNEVGFRIGSYDAAQPLVIDPVLDYSTYLADVQVGVNSVAVDAAGNSYVAGQTFSSGYPVSSGAYSCSTCTAGDRIFVTKLNASGTAQVYSTIIGGSGVEDVPSQIAVDSNGNAIVTVFSYSTDFPVLNSISSGPQQNYDGYVFSLAPNGASLNFSDHLGGGSGSSYTPTYPGTLVLDASNNIYVAGTTSSPYLPTTSGVLHAVSPSYGQSSIFLMKLLSTGALSYSAIVGDPQIGGVSGLLRDSDGNFYLVGTVGQGATAGKPAWPLTSNAAQTSFIAGATNGPFVTKVSADATQILYSTLIVTGNVTATALTPSKEVLLTGNPGNSFPYSANAYITPTGTSYAGPYLAKLSADGSTIEDATSLNINGNVVGTVNSIAVDSTGDIWMGGTGILPQLISPLQSLPATGSNAGFIFELNPAISSVLFSTYFGTVGVSQVSSLTFDAQGKLYVGGIAWSGLPTTPSSYLPTVATSNPIGNANNANRGFLAKIDPTVANPSLCFASVPTTINLSTTVGSSQSGSITIKSCGSADLTVSSIQLTGSSAFTSSNNCPGVLTIGSSCTVSLTFTATTATTSTGTLTINSNSTVSSYVIPVSATGQVPIASLSNGNHISFTTEILGDSTTNSSAAVVVRNTGAGKLMVNGAQTTITAGFNITGSTCYDSTGAPKAVAQNGICTIVMSFTPTATGTTTGTLTISSNDPVNPSLTVTLLGSALSAYPAPVLSSLTQSSVAMGSTGVSLTVQGSNFFPKSYIVVGGEALPTTYNGSLKATLDPALLTSTGELPVYVVNPAPGGQSNSLPLLVYQSIPVAAMDIVYEPISKILYASVSSSDGQYPNTVVPINPATGTIGTPIPVGLNPYRLALSGDSAYLYVGTNVDHTLQRINLATQQVERTFNLPIAPIFSLPTTVQDMHVVPGSPKLVAAALSASESPSEVGTALFDDSGQVAFATGYNSTTLFGVDSFTFTSDPSTIYAIPPRVSGGFMSTAAITSSSITPSASVRGSDWSDGYYVTSDGILLYTSSGQVWNPTTQTLLGTYPVPYTFEYGVYADVALNRTFILDGTVKSGYATIFGYNPSTFTLVNSTAVNTTGAPTDLIRWGTDGFAFRDVGTTNAPAASSIILLHSPELVQPATVGAPTLGSLSPANASAGSALLTLTVNGSGFVSTSRVSWNSTLLETRYISTTQLAAVVPASLLGTAGTAQIRVTNPGGAGTSSAAAFDITAPQVTLSATTLSFATQIKGVPSAAMSLKVTNSGSGVLNAKALYFSGTNAADFSQTNTCASPLGVNGSCNVSVIFTPSTAGAETATLQLEDNAADSPQSVTLSGTGVTPVFNLSSTNLAFGSITAGSTSAASSVTVTNSGSVALSSLSITLTGTNATDFTQTSTCGASLAAGANCAISVTFKPSLGTAEQAIISVSATGATAQTISLGGTGTPDFVPPKAGATSTSVPAGQSASYSFQETSVGGFSGNIILSCTNLPTYAACSFSPSTLTLASGATTNFTLTVTTQQTTTSQLRLGRASGVALGFVVLLPLLGICGARRKTRIALVALLVMFVSASAIVGCSSGSGSSGGGGTTTPTVHTTPAGTYTINVVANSGTATHSTAVTLTVN